MNREHPEDCRRLLVDDSDRLTVEQGEVRGSVNFSSTMLDKLGDSDRSETTSCAS